MGYLVAFWSNLDDAKALGCFISLATTHHEVFGEKYDRAWRSPKTDEIEGYKSRFWTSSGPMHQMSWDSPWEHERI